MWLRTNITVRMLGYLLVASILPLALLGVTAFETSKRLVTEQAEGENTRLAGDFLSYLQLYNDQVENVASNISANEAIGALLRRTAKHADSTYEDLETRVTMGRMLDSYVRIKGLVSIDVFSNAGAHFHVGETLSAQPVDALKLASLAQEARNDVNPVLWRGIDDNLNPGTPQSKVISLVRSIQHFSAATGKSDTVGLLVIALNDEIIRTFLRGAALAAGTQLMQIDRNGRVMLHSDPSQFGQDLNVELLRLIQAEKPPARLTLGAEGVLLRVSEPDAQQRRIVVIKPERLVTYKVNELARATLLLMGLGLFIMVFMTWNFARAVVAPIRAVSQGFNRLEKNPTDHPAALPAPRSNDEISQLILGYNRHLLTLQDQRHAVLQLHTSEKLIKEEKARVEQLNSSLELRVAEVSRLKEGLESRVRERTEALLASNQLLEANVRQLGQAREQLVKSEKLASLGALVAGVSHELNTPIGNALMAATTVHQRTREFAALVSQGKVSRTALETFMRASLEGNELTEKSLQRAAHLIASFKQVAVDQSSERRRQFDLALTVHDVATTFKYVHKMARQRLEVEIPAGIVMESYPGPLGQVLSNFVNNAMIHAFENGAEGDMHLKAVATANGRVTITFSDNGRGIAPAHLGRIFDPFFTTKLGTGGSGLGLSIVNNIVEGLLGGSIHVESTLGEGTLFVLDLPLVAPQ